jgi:hypothetical protein
VPGIFLYTIIRLVLQTPTAHRASHPGMDLSTMTTAEVEALLRFLAEWEREELELLM